MLQMGDRLGSHVSVRTIANWNPETPLCHCTSPLVLFPAAYLPEALSWTPRWASLISNNGKEDTWGVRVFVYSVPGVYTIPDIRFYIFETGFHVAQAGLELPI